MKTQFIGIDVDRERPVLKEVPFIIALEKGSFVKINGDNWEVYCEGTFDSDSNTMEYFLSQISLTLL